MIHILPVAEFVDNHAVNDLRRCKHQQAIEVQVTLRATTSPAGALVADGDATEADTDQRGVVADSLRDVL